jgi:heme-degrading monooxygenase HmoA
MAHHRLWQFRPRPGGERAFAEAYAKHGTWSELFARAEGFVETRLLRPADEGGWWLTIDSWDSLAAFERFQRDYGEEYRALDVALEAVAGDERFVGAFED